jgi:hypothetical protein
LIARAPGRSDSHLAPFFTVMRRVTNLAITGRVVIFDPFICTGVARRNPAITLNPALPRWAFEQLSRAGLAAGAADALVGQAPPAGPAGDRGRHAEIAAALRRFAIRCSRGCAFRTLRRSARYLRVFARN